MVERRSLDATYLWKILLWVLRTYGQVQESFDYRGSATAALRLDDFPSTVLTSTAKNLNKLAEHIRIITAIDIPTTSPDFGRRLAQIATSVSHASPGVAGSLDEIAEIQPICEQIRTDYAVACAVAYAQDQDCIVDTSKLNHDETSLALVMPDEDLLAEIFDGALYGNRVNGSELGNYESDSERFIAQINAEFMIAAPIPTRGQLSSERHLTRVEFKHMTAVASLERLTDDDVVRTLDDYLSLARGAGAPGRHAKGSSLGQSWHLIFPELHSSDSPQSSSWTESERQLPATSYWNLRSAADLEGWTSAEILGLIWEHLMPTLRSDLVHHHSCVSGAEWRRLYKWLYA